MSTIGKVHQYYGSSSHIVDGLFFLHEPSASQILIKALKWKNKFNIVGVLNKDKIQPKNKVRMSIPLCQLFSMPMVRLALKIDALIMEQAFQMG